MKVSIELDVKLLEEAKLQTGLSSDEDVLHAGLHALLLKVGTRRQGQLAGAPRRPQPAPKRQAARVQKRDAG